jgi:hypothetical protein
MKTFFCLLGLFFSTLSFAQNEQTIDDLLDQWNSFSQQEKLLFLEKDLDELSLEMASEFFYTVMNGDQRIENYELLVRGTLNSTHLDVRKITIKYILGRCELAHGPLARPYLQSTPAEAFEKLLPDMLSVEANEFQIALYRHIVELFPSLSTPCFTALLAKLSR